MRGQESITELCDLWQAVPPLWSAFSSGKREDYGELISRESVKNAGIRFLSWEWLSHELSPRLATNIWVILGKCFSIQGHIMTFLALGTFPSLRKYIELYFTIIFYTIIFYNYILQLQWQKDVYNQEAGFIIIHIIDYFLVKILAPKSPLLFRHHASCT